MEAAFWHWAHNTPAAHLYGIYTSQHSFRLGLYHSREQLQSLQQTMYLTTQFIHIFHNHYWIAFYGSVPLSTMLYY